MSRRRARSGRRGRPRNAILVAATVASIGSVAAPVAAQGIRGWAGTTVQAVDLRPFSAAPAECVATEPCYVRGDDVTSVVGMQDVSFTAWGFGVPGVSATVHLRGRTGFGSDAVWPRSGDHFDAILAYARYRNPRWSMRLGRQEIRSGLGFSSFDGVSAVVRLSRFEVEGYGGLSLARGLRGPANEALSGIEDFVPDRSVHLWGASARARFQTASATVRYQREILSDRSGLASERASLDATAAFPGVRLGGAIDWDFGLDRPGKGHLTASAPVASGRWVLSATARRYVPYFSLSTIWGFFEPVAYHELVGRVGWSPSPDLGVWTSGGVRRYGDTEASSILRPMEDTGWRGELGGTWDVASAWRLDARYRLEWVPGGFLSSADATVRWTVDPRLSVAFTGMSLQQIEQYRLGDGRARGIGVSVDAELTDRVVLAGGASVLRHTTAGDSAGSPWNQSRAWSTVRVRLGDDPGPANRSSRLRR